MKGNYTDNISAPSHLSLSRVALVGIRFHLVQHYQWTVHDLELIDVHYLMRNGSSIQQYHYTHKYISLKVNYFAIEFFFLRGSKLQLYLLGLGTCFGSWEKQCWIYLLYISSYLPPYFCFQNKMNTCFTWNCWWWVKQWFLFPCYIFMYSTPTNICWAKHRCHITDIQIRIIQSCHSAQVFVSTWPVWTLFTSYDRVSCGCKLLRFFELFWLHSGTALMWFQ